MKKQSSPNKSIKTNHRLRLLLAFIPAVFLLVLAVLIVTPLVLERVMEKTLVDMGAVNAEIEDIDFNPFNGVIHLHLLQGFSPPNDKALTISDAVMDYSWSPLLEERLQIKQLTITGAEIHIERLIDGSFAIGQLRLPFLQTKEREEGREPWQVGFDNIELRDITIVYNESKVQTQISAKVVEISGIESWNPQKSVGLKAQVTLNGQKIHFSGNLTPLDNSPHLRGRVTIPRADLSQFQAYLGTEKIQALSGYLGMDAEIEADFNNNEAIVFSADGAFSLANFILQLDTASVQTPSFDWKGMIGYNSLLPGINYQVQGKGVLTAKKIQMQSQSLSLRETDIFWQGPLSYGRKKTEQLAAVTAEGKLRVNAAEIDVERNSKYNFRDLQADVTIQTKEESNSGLSVKVDGGLNLHNLQTHMGDSTSLHNDVNWTGSLRTDYETESGLRISGQGDLAAAESEIGMKQKGYNLTQNNIKIGGEFSINGANSEVSSLQANLNGSSNNITLFDTDDNTTKIELDSIVFNDVALSNTQAMYGRRVKLSGVRVLERKQSLDVPVEQNFTAEIGESVFHNITVKDYRNLTIKTVDINDLHALIERNKKGDLTFFGKKKNEAEKSIESGNGSSFSIATIIVKGENNITYQDYSVSPAYSTSLSPFTLTIDNFSNQSSQTSSSLSLEGNIGRHSYLQVTGVTYPFRDPFEMDLQIDLQEFDLTTLSPYTQNRIGYSIDSGQLQADISWKIKPENELDMLFDLHLVKPQYTMIPQATEDGSSGGSNFAIKRSLDFLRNKRGNIDLVIPVSGNTNNPQFHFKTVFWEAFSKALQQGTVTYFAPIGVSLLTGVTLPPGAIWVIGKLFSKVTTLRFDPLIFDSLQGELNSTQQQQLNTMADLLLDRPEIELMICGISTPEDLLSIRSSAKSQPTGKTEIAAPDADELTKLIDLSDKRSHAVKNYLIEKGIASRRLITCRPDYVSEQGVTPSVELGI